MLVSSGKTVLNLEEDRLDTDSGHATAVLADEQVVGLARALLSRTGAVGELLVRITALYYGCEFDALSPPSKERYRDQAARFLLGERVGPADGFGCAKNVLVVAGIWPNTHSDTQAKTAQTKVP